MNEEVAQEEPEITDVPEPQEVDVPIPDTEEPPKEETKFDPKKDKVEFSTPEQQARFNEVFRQLKKSDQRNMMLTDFLQEYGKELEKVKGHIAQTSESDAEKTLMDRVAKAREEGDDAAYDKAFADLVEFRSEKKVDKKIKEHLDSIGEKESKEHQKQAQFIASAMSETDEMGNYKRPWLQEDHPDFNKMKIHVAELADTYRNDPMMMEKILSGLDEIMGVSVSDTSKRNGNSRMPNPMQGSNLTNKAPDRKIKMTRKELEVVRQLERHSGRKIDLTKYAARRSAMGGQNG